MMGSGIMFVSEGFLLLAVCHIGCLVMANMTTVTTTPSSTVPGGNETSTVTGGNETNVTTSVSWTDSTSTPFVTSGMPSKSTTVITSTVTSSSTSDIVKLSPEAKKKMEEEKLRRKNIHNGIAAIVVVIGSIILISIASCTSKLDKPTRKIKHETIGHVEQKGQNLRAASCDSIENIRTAL